MFDMWIAILIGLIIVSIATEAITEILISTALLDIVGLRPWAANKAVPQDPQCLDKVRWYHTALHKLLTCGYCSSVWVSFITAWFVPGNWLGMLPWDNIVIKIFLVHRLANSLHVVYELVRRGRVHTVDVAHKLVVESGDEREFRPGNGASDKTPDSGNLQATDSKIVG